MATFSTSFGGGGAVPAPGRPTRPLTATFSTVSPAATAGTASNPFTSSVSGSSIFNPDADPFGTGGIFENNTGIFFPGTTSTAPPAPQPPPSATATASDLQIIMSAIPIAQDGHVITADFHNSLRLALVAIANRLGIGPVAEEVTITNAPRLSSAIPPAFGITPPVPTADWLHDYGHVRNPGNFTSGNVRGWMEVELPHGGRIKKMMVFGTTAGAGTLKIRLRQQKITDPTVVTDLIVIEIPDGNDMTKGIEGDVTVPGTGAGSVAIEEFRIVNNREQKYLLAVDLDAVASGTTATFHSMQIVCGR